MFKVRRSLFGIPEQLQGESFVPCEDAVCDEAEGICGSVCEVEYEVDWDTAKTNFLPTAIMVVLQLWAILGSTQS